MAGNPNYQIVITQEGGDSVIAYLPESFSYDASSQFSQPFAQGLSGLVGGGMLGSLAAVLGYRLASQAMTAEVWQGSSTSDLSLPLDFYADTDAKADVRDKIVALMKMATPGVDPSGLLTSPGPQLDVAGTRNVIANSINSVGNTLQKNSWPGSSWVQNIASFVSAAPTPSPNTSNTMVDPTQASNNTPQNSNTSTSVISALKANIKNQVSIKIGRYAFFDSVVVRNVQKTWESTLDENGRPMHAKAVITFAPLFTVVQTDLDNIFL